MTSSNTYIGAAIGPSTDIGAIWSAAVARYEATTSAKVQTLAGTKSVDDILMETKDREKSFTSRRHDGSKLDKFRTLVRQSLGPIQILGDIVSNATKTVKNLLAL